MQSRKKYDLQKQEQYNSLQVGTYRPGVTPEVHVHQETDNANIDGAAAVKTKAHCIDEDALNRPDSFKYVLSYPKWIIKLKFVCCVISLNFV